MSMIVGSPCAYATIWPLTENPVSESSAWAGGLTVGLDWHNIQSNGSYAYSSTDVPGNFTDNTALLTDPRWLAHPNQHARGRVRTISQDPSKFQELELHLRTTMTAHTVTGYEVFFKCAKDGTTQYVALARWDGPQGSFTVNQTIPSGVGIVDGDYIDAYITGNIITAYINNSLQLTWDITSAFNGVPFYVGGVNQGNTVTNGAVYQKGYPGIGMDEGSPGGSTLTNWGFYSFYAEALP